MYAAFGKQLENTKGAPSLEEWQNISQELIASVERIVVGNVDLDEELESFNDKAKSMIE